MRCQVPANCRSQRQITHLAEPTIGNTAALAERISSRVGRHPYAFEKVRQPPLTHR